jgi:hypothetical protein
MKYLSQSIQSKAKVLPTQSLQLVKSHITCVTEN